MSDTDPRSSVMFAKRSGSVVSMSNHQAGCTAMSASVFRVSAGGVVKPLRTSRMRSPDTCVSTVSSSAVKPAAFARSTSAWLAPRSRQT